MRVLMVVGTRPEIIKLGPVYRELINRNVDVDVFWSGQHIEMTEGLWELFDMKVTYNWKFSDYSMCLSEKTADIITGISKIINTVKYDWIVIQGDTISAMAGSLCGFLGRVPVAHVEAGLRSNNFFSPFPEEYNRRIITLGTTLHFAPTSQSINNLIIEGIHRDDIVRTGNTVIDAIEYASKKIDENYVPVEPKIRELDETKKLILVTMHRRENIGSNMEMVIKSIATLAEDGDKLFVLPVHMNPEVSDLVHSELGNKSNVILVDPLVYTDMVYLLKKCWTVITDSGGLQEEVPSMNLHLIITRDTTERPEVIDSGFGTLVGCDYFAILNRVRELTSQKDKVKLMKDNPFGDGTASVKIVDALLR